MSTYTTNAAESDEAHDRSTTDALPRGDRIRTTLSTHGRNGTIAAVAGGILLAVAGRTAGRNRRRAGLLALVGAALIGLGIRQRRSIGGGSSTIEDVADAEAAEPAQSDEGSTDAGGDRTEAGDEESSAEARAHLEQSKVLHQSETNPRGVSDEPDVETETEPDEGDVRFTTDGDDGEDPKPHLDDTEDGDPRVPESDPTADEDHVEVDLSESAMADEASEATGPNPEQAYPAREGTDPEPTSPEAPEAQGEGAVASRGSEDEEAGTGDGTGEAGDDGRETEAEESEADEDPEDHE